MRWVLAARLIVAGAVLGGVNPGAVTAFYLAAGGGEHGAAAETVCFTANLAFGVVGASYGGVLAHPAARRQPADPGDVRPAPQRPAVAVPSDSCAGAVSTLVVAEVTKNLTLAGDPARLFIDVGTPEGKGTRLLQNSVASCLLLAAVDADRVARVLGSLSPALKQKLNGCLKAALGLP